MTKAELKAVWDKRRQKNENKSAGPNASMWEVGLGAGASASTYLAASQTTLKEVGPYTRVYGPNTANSALGLPGRNYLTENLAGYQSQHLLESANSLKGLGATAGISIFANLIDYGYGQHSDQGVLSQEFAVSAGVDTVFGVAGGIAAATIVGGAVAAGLFVAAPLAVVGLTMAVGIGIGVAINASGASDMAKNDVNWAIDSLQGQ